jgi:hypothetical protein
MKSNSETKQFAAKMAAIVANQKAHLTNEVAQHIDAFKGIHLTPFTNTTPYNGETKNRIFLTYSDHYKGNLPTWMSVGNLKHPHTNMGDRGYIKGVVTDLDGYIKLRSASFLNHNCEAIASIYLPRFRRSKYSNEYRATCAAIIKAAKDELDEFVSLQKATMNEALKELTSCSLLHYLREI